MDRPPAALEADWLGACRRASERLREMLAAHPTTRERAVVTGRGEGGDRTLVIDRAAEQIVFDELDELSRAGQRFVAVSEERGLVDYGDESVRFVIDPIDGSLNAKRGVPQHALSIAVAQGDSMADVVFGYVYDLGSDEEFVATRGGGARLNGVLLPADAPERRWDDGRLELIGIESADPRHVAVVVGDLAEQAHRLRVVGAIAISLCQVAAARFDGMVSLQSCRSVDAAAAQLIVREAGGVVAFTACDQPLGASLDLVPRSPVAAARSAEGLAGLASIPS
jgi:myo-inositol-1(or 4)-monophosphatase